MNAIHRVLDPRKNDRVPAGLCALAVMTKAPQAGRVKTRLTPPLSPEEAAALNICFLRDTTAAISRTTNGKSARGIAVYTPVGTEAAYAEIYVTDTLWPDFRGYHLLESIADYQTRERRYGGLINANGKK